MTSPLKDMIEAPGEELRAHGEMLARFDDLQEQFRRNAADAVQARGYASAAAVPMTLSTRMLGAVTVALERRAAFHEEEVTPLNEVAGDLAFARQSTEHERERRQAEEALRQSEERLCAKRPGLKVIFMSGYSSDLVGKNAEFLSRTGGCYLHKPCATVTLIQAVRQCLDAKELKEVEG